VTDRGAAAPTKCSQCGAANPVGNKFCGECGGALTSATRTSAVTAGLAGEPAPVAPVAERRVCSVLFCDLVSAQQLAAEAESIAERLGAQPLLERVRRLMPGAALEQLNPAALAR
jgi:hypothetical protein